MFWCPPGGDPCWIRGKFRGQVFISAGEDDGWRVCVRACRDGDPERVTISGAGAHLAGRDLPHGPYKAVFGHMAPILISVCFTMCVCECVCAL